MFVVKKTYLLGLTFQSYSHRVNARKKKRVTWNFAQTEATTEAQKGQSNWDRSQQKHSSSSDAALSQPLDIWASHQAQGLDLWILHSPPPLNHVSHSCGTYGSIFTPSLSADARVREGAGHYRFSPKGSRILSIGTHTRKLFFLFVSFFLRYEWWVCPDSLILSYQH